MVDTYEKLDGHLVRIDGLTEQERVFLHVCAEAYRANMAWEHFSNLAEGRVNPLIAATGGLITPDVRRHPLYQVVRDLEDRLGLKQGKLASSPDLRLDRDPFSANGVNRAPDATDASNVAPQTAAG
jgi:hypothetical protein